MKRRLELLEKYCNREDTKYLYGKLKECNDRTISMCFAEYRCGEKEHWHSNLWSCLYDFKKKYNVEETMEELVQLCEDICFSVGRVHQVHNFKIEKHLI